MDGDCSRAALLELAHSCRGPALPIEMPQLETRARAQDPAPRLAWSVPHGPRSHHSNVFRLRGRSRSATHPLRFNPLCALSHWSVPQQEGKATRQPRPPSSRHPTGPVSFLQEIQCNPDTSNLPRAAVFCHENGIASRKNQVLAEVAAGSHPSQKQAPPPQGNVGHPKNKTVDPNPHTSSATAASEQDRSASSTAECRPPRVFVGLKMAPEVAGALARIGHELARFDVREVAADDIHLTLVPPWNEASPSGAAERLRLVAERLGTFTLAIQHVQYGPDRRRPRLLWADCLASAQLMALRQALLDTFGQTDPRPFHPHVTLARIRRHGRAIARKYPIERRLSLTQQVESVELFQSPPPGQAGYRVLASGRLRVNSAIPGRNHDDIRRNRRES